ncbi:lipoprotein [Spiroplasma sp. DGKH1]|uniref:lipoprotein n=1 Tax=Spiroplasma sp. DGKH1 TaxID=3050074 RepID=UPI0034C5D889
MKKLLAIFGAVGLTATGASNIVACHKEETTTGITEEAQKAINSYITFTFVSHLFTKNSDGSYSLAQKGQGTLSLIPDNIMDMNSAKINGVDIPMSILSATGIVYLGNFITSLGFNSESLDPMGNYDLSQITIGEKGTSTFVKTGDDTKFTANWNVNVDLTSGDKTINFTNSGSLEFEKN